MAKFGLLIGWGNPVRGRESQASAVFDEAVRLWQKLQKDGTIEAWEAVRVEPHGGDLAGFFLLRGKRRRIARLRGGEELADLARRAGHVVDHFGIVGVELGAQAERARKKSLRHARELAQQGSVFYAGPHD